MVELLNKKYFAYFNQFFRNAWHTKIMQFLCCLPHQERHIGITLCFVVVVGVNTA